MSSPIVNARDVAALKRKDKLFSRIAERYGDPPNWKRRPGFVSLCHIILEQQVRIDSAKAHFARLKSYLPREQLMVVKGIGQWTADIYSMFCLQAEDIFPLGDIAVASAVVELHPGSSRFDIETHSERWKPYRSLAAYYLWHYYLRKRGRSA